LLQVLVVAATLLAGSVAQAVTATAAAGGSGLGAGEGLTSGQRIVAPHGGYSLVEQSDGNAVVYTSAGRVLWNSRTAGHPGSRLAMQGDGNLVVYGPDGRALWNSRTGGHPGSRLAMQDDGNLVIYAGNGAATWSTGPAQAAPTATGDRMSSGQTLRGGQGIRSANGFYRLVMQSDGNAVTYAPPGRPIWNTRTGGHTGTWLALQSDGNLVLYSAGGVPLWNSRTGGHPGSVLRIQNDGNLVLYASSGAVLWSTGWDRALPMGIDAGNSTEVVTVVAPSARSTTATLTSWQLTSAGWKAVVGPMTAYVGAAGVGAASEDVARTPQGVFTLTEAFGRAADPGTALPYRRVDAQDWWVSDRTSPLYNQHARCAAGSCPFDESVSENLYGVGPVYDYAAVIDYNRSPAVPGAGSGFFLHVTNHVPTAGCVAIERAALVTLLTRLRPAEHPVIAIGIG
jgi:L,D-peptidoglycan transpeptidase YkuD (ErfK/YbiS/YcfS/YnhG family)